ncbi:P27 family phage terminase small subunit [Streptomyces qinzhouensis]|uniref:P27 family phage terminase small subunit n=1 Tax=Streptomyces qinzhouensis TaxID=2599401 RepID=A0A5B8JHG9_9ACTN|nr:P27 family phage terminase small subunit [Streptomyces qinzhouensis]QDY79784.1 P27 family phage terminase small subunit [Streptomyces qinzhouensis]
MAVPGQKPKPHIQAVREGTFRPDRNSEGARFAPLEPIEPDWTELLPGDASEDVRGKAADVWARTVPALVASAGLTDSQRETVIEYCLTVARLWQAERELSRTGLVVETERGNVKSPWVTIAHQYRTHFRSLVGELGLSPAAATRITPPDFGGDDDDDVFD